MRARTLASWKCRPIRSGSERATHRFLDSLRGRRLAESTIRTKQRLILRFRAWLYVEGRASSFAAIDEQTAREYRRWHASHLSPTSWNPVLAGVAQFFRWAARHQLVLLDPFEHVRTMPCSNRHAGREAAARRLPARTIAHPFRARCRRRDAARVGGDPIITRVQVAESLVSEPRSLSPSTMRD